MTHKDFINFMYRLKEINLFKDYEKEISSINLETDKEIERLKIQTIYILSEAIGHNIQCYELNCFQKGIYSNSITTSENTGLLLSDNFLLGIVLYSKPEKYIKNIDIFNIIKKHNKGHEKIRKDQQSCLNIIKEKYSKFL